MNKSIEKMNGQDFFEAKISAAYELVANADYKKAADAFGELVKLIENGTGCGEYNKITIYYYYVYCLKFVIYETPEEERRDIIGKIITSSKCLIDMLPEDFSDVPEKYQILYEDAWRVAGNLFAWYTHRTGGDLQEALTVIETAIDYVTPDHAFMCDTYAHILMALGREDDAYHVANEVTREGFQVYGIIEDIINSKEFLEYKQDQNKPEEVLLMKKLEAADFEFNDLEYVADGSIWGGKTKIVVLVPPECKQKDFEKQINQIKELCEWVQNNRKQIEEELMDMGYLDREDYINYYCHRKMDDEGNYIMPNGEKIMMPLTEEVFKQNLVMEKFAIYFCDSDPDGEQDFEADYRHPVCNLLMSSKPHTCDVLMSLLMDSEKQFECDGEM